MSILSYIATRRVQTEAINTYFNARKSGLRMLQQKWRKIRKDRRQEAREEKLRKLRTMFLKLKFLHNIYSQYVIPIQAVARGFLWRKRNKKTMMLLQDVRIMVVKHFYYYRAARTMQRYWRGYLSRVHYRMLVTAAIIVQTFMKTKLAHAWWGSMTQSATMVQNKWRDWYTTETEKALGENNTVEERIVGFVFGQVDLLHLLSYSAENPWLQGLREISRNSDILLTLAVGNNHSLVIAESKGRPEVYMFPNTGLGIQWMGFPGLTAEYIVQISCGADHFAVRSVSGLIYTWGDSKRGQCGLDVFFSAKPQKVNLPYLATNVHCGPMSTGVVLQNGWVMVCGDDGAEFRGTGANQSRFLRVFPLPPVSEVVCGPLFNIARSRLGDLFSWGFSELGQLGFGSKIKRKREPIRIDFGMGFTNKNLPPITQISLGNSHAAVLTADNEIALWGTFSIFDTGGSLGRPLRRIISPTLVDHAKFKQPRLITCSAEGVLVICGKTCYSFQLVKLAPSRTCLIPSLKEYELNRRPETLRSDFSASISIAWTETLEEQHGIQNNRNEGGASSSSMYRA